MMNDYPDHISQLIYRCILNQLTEKEAEELENWKASAEENQALFNRLTREPHFSEALARFREADTSEAGTLPRVLALARNQSTGERKQRPLVRIWLRLSAAAVLILAVFIYLLYTHNRENAATPAGADTLVSADVAPGADKAVLILADGSRIEIDSASSGNLATQGGIAIEKLASGEIRYHYGTAPGTSLINTMATPKGGQYRLTLADGTRVWLNASSSITYPTAFTGDQRKVSVTGELYFEVAPDPQKPFTVESEGQTIEVLGTRFNINAYDDEPAIKSTLLEGSIKLNAAGRSAVLQPGQQSTVDWQQPTAIRITKADTSLATAWKNGFFDFNEANLPDVMRQLARWYDMEIVYPQGIPPVQLGGEIQKTLPLSEMLDALGAVEIKFEIQDKQLIVLP